MKNEVRTTRRGQAARFARRVLELTYDPKAMQAWAEAEILSAAETDAAERFEMAVIDSGKGKVIQARAEADGVDLYQIVVAIDIDARKSNRSMDKGFLRLVDQYAEGGGGEVRQDSYRIILEPKSRIAKLTSINEQDDSRLVRKTEQNQRQQTLDQLQSLLETVRSQAHGNAAFATESAVLLGKTLEELRVLSVEPRPFNQEQIERDADPHKPLMSAQETIDRLKGLRDREALQAFLDRFVVGKTWGNLEDNQYIAYGLTDHLRSLKLRLTCSKDDEPSYLRAIKTGGAPEGGFYFEHYTAKQQQRHGGAKVVPPLKITSPPPDLRRKFHRPS